MNSIEVDTTCEPASQPEMAVERRPDASVGRAMTAKELHDRLEFVREIMRKEMREGQDYGKIPGCGDKPSLLQPGAQKLLMTFNLREQIKREVMRDLAHPSIPGHREYEFVVTVFPAAQGLEFGWDGVGTCSTFESKYRYRKAERKCPKCGKSTIIAGKEEYGGGFICWKKKGGCGEKFATDEPAIVNRPADDVENEDPADSWNTCRKMAFKRALVAAAINATNTSELWTQDLEDMAQNQGHKSPARTAPAAPPAPRATQAAPAPPAPTAAAASNPKFATAATRQWFLKKIGANAALAKQFCEQIAWLLPTEPIDSLELRFVPVSTAEMDAFLNCMGNWQAGGDPVKPYDSHPEPEGQPKKAKKTASPPPAAEPPKKAPKDDEAWREAVVPIPPKGVKMTDYTHPDTIGSLYDRAKEGDTEARKRLYGFTHHFEPKPWIGRDGQKHDPSDADKQFRAALDQFADWRKSTGDDFEETGTFPDF